LRIDILLFDGFDELDAIAPFEVFSNVARGGGDFKVRMVSMAPSTNVVAAHGLCVTAEKLSADDPRPDLILIPGGGWNDRSPQGARAEVASGVIPKHLAKLHEDGTTIAAVCTGTMLVAAAGILRGRAATTHHGGIEDLRTAGAELIDARVVDDGDIITSGGVTSGLDLALWLVERFAGPQVALHIEREMEYERRGTVWRRK
jgi:transcriptional regulator GlxA family with amidase domain